MTVDDSGLVLLTALLLKHFVFDWLYQPPWMWRNKGTWGHPGGVAHSALHAFATFPLLLLFGVNVVLAGILAAAEYTIHYHVDWAKMNINARMGWKCNEHHAFWVLTGVDQTLHMLTYVGLVALSYGAV